MHFLLSLFILTALFAQETVESRNWMNQGADAFRAAQYAVAIQAFQRAIDLDPSSVTARLYLAIAYMQQYIPWADSNENSQIAARAKEAFSQVLVFDPTNKMALVSLASLYLNQKKWDDAQQWYEKLIAVEPGNADAYYSLGFIAWSEWYPAYQAARTSAGLKPEDPGPIPDLVVKQDLRGRWGSVIEEGIARLQKTLELNPRYEDAMSYMSLLIRERADLRDTKEEWRQDIALANQWLETKKAGGGAGVSPQARQASSLVGLPQYGVTLSGTPENPVIENHSGRLLIGYDMKLATANDRGMILSAQIMALSALPAGVPDGGAVYARESVPVNSNIPMPRPTHVVRGAGLEGPIVTATLRSVIFADGQFVGTDEQGAFEQFGKKLRAVKEAGILAKTGAWDQIEALAQAFMQRPRLPLPAGEDPMVYMFRQLTAQRLIETRRNKGDAAAHLAEIYSSLPTVWK
jgi:tetratricopeptide (TPR) repeat protein